MKQITLRNIPKEIEEIVKKEAKRKGLSLNRSFISLLETATGYRLREKSNKKRYHDLDHLSGVWTKEETIEFNSNLESQRKIDEQVWKETE